MILNSAHHASIHGALALAALWLIATVPCHAKAEQNDLFSMSSGRCPAQDACGRSDLLGYRWNGAACEALVGCECVGNDCDELFGTLEKCQARFCRCLCEPQDAQGSGKCKKLLGWRWDGARCEALGGCECLGEACGELYHSEEQCSLAHRGCPCAAQDVEPVGLCEVILGWTWNGGQCTDLTGCSCVGEDCDELYASIGECQKDRLKCICRGQDAQGEGPCDLFLGYRWDGEQCVGESGCVCKGADCDSLWATLKECQAVHETCPCRAQDARGEGPCDAVLGYIWNGAVCEEISGCVCVGTDCKAIFTTMAGCKGAHVDCICRNQDARISGPCDRYWGYRWDGFECVEENMGCECIGADCDELFATADECEKTHAKCLCRIMDAKGVGNCDQFFGYRWTGTRCESISGCSCVGNDCNSLFQTLDLCRKAHADCDPCCGCKRCLAIDRD